MVKTSYSHNNQFVDEEIYEAALILHNISGINTSSKKVFGPLEPTRYRTRRSLIASPKKHVDMDNIDDDYKFLGSTSTNNIVNEQPPSDEVNVNNNDEELEVAAAAARGVGAMPSVPVIANIIGACSPPFEKQLTKTDVTEGQGRLTLRKEFVNLHLVPMFNEDEDLVEGIDVTVYDSEGREYDMSFKLWTSKLYVLTKGWNEFYKTNNLTKAGRDVTLWMFRHVVTQKLCFAIIEGRNE